MHDSAFFCVGAKMEGGKRTMGGYIANGIKFNVFLFFSFSFSFSPSSSF